MRFRQFLASTVIAQISKPARLVHHPYHECLSEVDFFWHWDHVSISPYSKVHISRGLVTSIALVFITEGLRDSLWIKRRDNGDIPSSHAPPSRRSPLVRASSGTLPSCTSHASFPVNEFPFADWEPMKNETRFAEWVSQYRYLRVFNLVWLLKYCLVRFGGTCGWWWLVMSGRHSTIPIKKTHTKVSAIHEMDPWLVSCSQKSRYYILLLGLQSLTSYNFKWQMIDHSVTFTDWLVFPNCRQCAQFVHPACRRYNVRKLYAFLNKAK